MACLFNNCISLTKMPNISNWETYSLKNINKIFYNCSSLLFLPDISNWNISKMISHNDEKNDFYSSITSSFQISSSNNNLSFNSVSNNNILENHFSYEKIFYINFFEQNSDLDKDYYSHFYS